MSDTAEFAEKFAAHIQHDVRALNDSESPDTPFANAAFALAAYHIAYSVAAHATTHDAAQSDSDFANDLTERVEEILNTLASNPEWYLRGDLAPSA
jgi:hypothetical protein